MTVIAESDLRALTIQPVVAARCAQMIVSAASSRPKGEEPREFFRTINRVAGIVAGLSAAECGGVIGSPSLAATAQDLCEMIAREVEVIGRQSSPDHEWARKGAGLYLRARVAATLVEAGL